MNREQCIDKMYRKVMEEVPISREAFGNSLQGVDIKPMILEGECVGVQTLRGNEIHCMIDRQASLQNMRRLIRMYCAEPLERFGSLTTRCDPNDKRDVVFLHRMGFEDTGLIDGLLHMRLLQLKIQ